VHGLDAQQSQTMNQKSLKTSLPNLSGKASPMSNLKTENPEQTMRLYEFIRMNLSERGQMPTQRTMAAFMGWRNPGSVQDPISRLTLRGLLIRKPCSGPFNKKFEYSLPEAPHV
jgi:hypothetical protein